MVTAPPYALDTPRPRFPALAARAARAPLGGGRETVLAVLVVARLAAGLLAKTPLSQPLREARAAAAHGWLTALTLPTLVRAPLLRAIDASAGDPAVLREALAGVIQVTSAQLDAGTVAEVGALLGEAGG